MSAMNTTKLPRNPETKKTSNNLFGVWGLGCRGRGSAKMGKRKTFQSKATVGLSGREDGEVDEGLGGGGERESYSRFMIIFRTLESQTPDPKVPLKKILCNFVISEAFVLDVNAMNPTEFLSNQ